jgi:hypothetical protein
VSNRYVHVERKAGHTVHDTVADAYAPFSTDGDAEAAASLLNIFGDVLGFGWLAAEGLDAYEAELPEDTEDSDGDTDD